MGHGTRPGCSPDVRDLSPAGLLQLRHRDKVQRSLPRSSSSSVKVSFRTTHIAAHRFKPLRAQPGQRHCRHCRCPGGRCSYAEASSLPGKLLRSLCPTRPVRIDPLPRDYNRNVSQSLHSWMTLLGIGRPNAQLRESSPLRDPMLW